MASKTQELTLIRGLPGSSKTTLANKLASQNNGVCVSADDFFTKEDGVYDFNFNLIKAAHQYSVGQTFFYLSRGKNVYVHNTFTQKWEMGLYIELAYLNKYKWNIIEPSVKWKFDVDELVRKNTHGVPKSTIEKMLARWEKTPEIIKYFENIEWMKNV